MNILVLMQIYICIRTNIFIFTQILFYMRFFCMYMRHCEANNILDHNKKGKIPDQYLPHTCIIWRTHL